jgi:hypothetical protein
LTPEAALPTGDATAEVLRRLYHRREIMIKTLGALECTVGMAFGVFGLGAVAAVLVYMLSSGGFVLEAWMPGVLTIGVLGLGAAAVLYLAGRSLRRLRPWARNASAALAALAMLLVLICSGAAILGVGLIAAAGIATILGLIPGAILSLLLSPSSAVIFTPEYQTLIEKTPTYRADPPRWYRMLGIMLLAAVVVCFLVYLAVLAGLGSQ